MKNWLAGWICLWSVGLIAQESFRLKLNENSALTNVPAIHSGAFVAHGEYWVFIGGRKNGLHGFQPPFAFPNNGINDKLRVVHPATNQMWEASLNGLPDTIREAVTSSNLQFSKRDSILYLVGGYGWVADSSNFYTFPTLTALDLNGAIRAVQQGGAIEPFFRQIRDERLAVCGAHLAETDSGFQLVFGHRFDGRYDRSDTTGFFRQAYTNQIRSFDIDDNGVQMSLVNYQTVEDTNQFRRRDYNLLPQLFPLGDKGYTAFSGVFRKGVNLPYLDCISIRGNTYYVHQAFQQQYSHYHSAVAMLYDSSAILQHNLFFGGMSMYYVDTLTGNTITDSLVPFVNTISDVVRNLDNTYFELLADVRMPALTGTNAYFMNDPAVPVIWNNIIDLNALADSVRIGYIIGGIESPEINISITDPSLSYASARVIEVWLVKGTETGMRPAGDGITSGFMAYPNPVNERITIEFNLLTAKELQIQLMDPSGRVLQTVFSGKMEPGSKQLEAVLNANISGPFFCTLQYGKIRRAIRMVKR